jgi:hypothetical protein
MEIDMHHHLQITTKPVRIDTIIRSKAFVTGFTEARRGKSPDFDRFRFAKEQWDYERGRLLAFVFPGNIKQGRAVTNSACIAYAVAHNQKAII